MSPTQARMNAAAAGVFPDCGCHYTIYDDGIHFCPTHAQAFAMREALASVYRDHIAEKHERMPAGVVCACQHWDVTRALLTATEPTP